MTNLVTYSHSDPISRIVMVEALHAAFDEMETDKTVVVLTGSGNTFSADLDLKVFPGGLANAMYTMLKAGAELAL